MAEKEQCHLREGDRWGKASSMFRFNQIQFPWSQSGNSAIWILKRCRRCMLLLRWHIAIRLMTGIVIVSATTKVTTCHDITFLVMLSMASSIHLNILNGEISWIRIEGATDGRMGAQPCRDNAAMDGAGNIHAVDRLRLGCYIENVGAKGCWSQLARRFLQSCWQRQPRNTCQLGSNHITPKMQVQCQPEATAPTRAGEWLIPQPEARGGVQVEGRLGVPLSSHADTSKWKIASIVMSFTSAKAQARDSKGFFQTSEALAVWPWLLWGREIFSLLDSTSDSELR